MAIQSKSLKERPPDDGLPDCGISGVNVVPPSANVGADTGAALIDVGAVGGVLNGLFCSACSIIYYLFHISHRYSYFVYLFVLFILIWERHYFFWYHCIFLHQKIKCRFRLRPCKDSL